MSTRAAPLGRCPECDAAIPAGNLLIAYERRDGPACYAECPACEAVVHPKQG
jgi:uncharacterized C2H2 Zn-finger protein